jgi:acetylornithine/succinyldiaminopimelate/putrescine aminotransferase
VQKALGGLASKRHSNTFGGGSLAMAVALKSLEMIIEEGLIERAKDLGKRGLGRLQAIQRDYPDIIAEVRGAGMLFALQFRPLIPPRHLGDYGELAAQFTSGLALRSLHQGGVHACYTLNSSSTLRLTPALNIPEPLFDTLFDRTHHAISQHPRSWQLVPQTPLTSLLKLARLALK